MPRKTNRFARFTDDELARMGLGLAGVENRYRKLRDNALDFGFTDSATEHNKEVGEYMRLRVEIRNEAIRRMDNSIPG